MKKINISLNPTYYCNLRCSFCYLTEKQLGDRKVLSLEKIEKTVDHILETREIDLVDIYGGEILLQDSEYLSSIRDIFHDRGIENLVITTNLTALNDIVYDPSFEIGISYDGIAREMSEKTYGNMLLMPQGFNVLTLVSRKFIDTVDIDEYVDEMNSLTNLKCVELKPYSTNQSNEDFVGFNEFEEVVLKLAKHPKRRFWLENIDLIESSLSGERNSFSDDHVYITPNGKLAVLDFDDSDREMFVEMDSMDDYERWCIEEKERVVGNQFCSSCKYLGRCLSEHIRDVKNLEGSCNGFVNLLDGWEKINGPA